MRELGNFSSRCLKVHEPGDEMWLFYGVSPLKFNVLHLDMDAHYDLHFTKKAFTAYDRGSNCQKYDDAAVFNECSRSAMQKMVAENINCTWPSLVNGFYTTNKHLLDGSSCAP